MGIFFFGVGFLFRQGRQYYKPHWYTTLLFFGIVWFFSQYAKASMDWKSTFNQFLSLPLPAICGCLMTYNIASWIDRHDGITRRLLVYVGDHTLPIFVFHIISYKVVSVVKIMYYHLEWEQIGCHMVIHEHAADDCFWILYTIAGVGIPTAVNYAYERLVAATKRSA